MAEDIVVLQKVIAVGKGQGQAPMVAWLSHAGTLIRAAPEHLRMATSLETRTYDILADSGVVSHNNMAGSRDVTLGEVPTPAEDRAAQHMQIDEPPPPDGPGESRSSSSTGPYRATATRPPPTPPMARMVSREEPDAGRAPAPRSCRPSSSSPSLLFFMIFR